MNIKHSFVGFGVVSILIGCSLDPKVVKEGPAPGVRVSDQNAPYANARMNTVVIVDRNLQSDKSGRLAVERSGARRTATGTLEVIAVIRNRTDFPQQIEYRVQFFDSQEFPVESASSWRRTFIGPQGVQPISEFSVKTSEVAYYYVEIREAQ